MAGDWIKMRTDLYRDPKVCVIADSLMARDGDLARYVSQMNQRDMTVTRNVTRNATVGALVTVWGVMRHRGKPFCGDLICRGVSISIIDDVADLPGFGAAMASVGWVVETDEGIVFPSFFAEYNVDPTEKKASASAERQRRYRESQKKKSDVTRDVTRDVTVTHREEKRREEEKEEKIGASPDGEALTLTAERQPAIPYQAIVHTYNATMVNLPKVREISADRKTAMRKAWMTSDQRQSVEFWRAYFEECAAEPFTNGTGPYTGEHANWRPDFDYLMRGKVITRIFERAMDRLERSAA